jgi:hypothetical protein
MPCNVLQCGKSLCFIFYHLRCNQQQKACKNRQSQLPFCCSCITTLCHQLRCNQHSSASLYIHNCKHFLFHFLDTTLLGPLEDLWVDVKFINFILCCHHLWMFASETQNFLVALQSSVWLPRLVKIS